MNAIGLSAGVMRTALHGSGDEPSPHLPRGSFSCTPSSALPDVFPGFDLVLESGEELLVSRDLSKERAKWISCQTLFCRRCSQDFSVWAGDPRVGGEGAGRSGTGTVGGGTGSPLCSGGLRIPGLARGSFLRSSF